jgi:hypothetical protein
MKAVPDSHNYRKHEETSRELERRFGHERVQGAHVEREGRKRPDRTPSRAELRQEERTGITGKQVKAEVSEAFRTSDSPAAFKAALEERGYQLARGDRRDYVVIDSAGSIHSLARRIDSMKAADLRAYMSPLDGGEIPSIAESRARLDAIRRQGSGGEGPDLVKAYGRSGSYVSQSLAAQKDHAARQERLERQRSSDTLWDRIEAGEDRRAGGRHDDTLTEDSARKRDQAQAGDEERSNSPGDDITPAGVEISDAMQARLDRLHEAQGGYSTGRSRGPQNEAPGGGRPRGR